MKNLKLNESLWFNKPVYFSMIFLTMSSMMTSCSIIKSTPDLKVPHQSVIVNAPNIQERILLACDVVNDVYVCDRLN